MLLISSFSSSLQDKHVIHTHFIRTGSCTEQFRIIIVSSFTQTLVCWNGRSELGKVCGQGREKLISQGMMRREEKVFT